MMSTYPFGMNRRMPFQNRPVAPQAPSQGPMVTRPYLPNFSPNMGGQRNDGDAHGFQPATAQTGYSQSGRPAPINTLQNIFQGVNVGQPAPAPMAPMPAPPVAAPPSQLQGLFQGVNVGQPAPAPMAPMPATSPARTGFMPTPSMPSYNPQQQGGFSGAGEGFQGAPSNGPSGTQMGSQSGSGMANQYSAHGGRISKYAPGGGVSKYDLMKMGVNEAPDMRPKAYFNPASKNGFKVPSMGGVNMPNGMPIGGADMSSRPGQQLMPPTPQAGALPSAPAPAPAPAPMGNMLSMTPQGQAMNAMRPPMQQMAPQRMAEGGSPKKQRFAIKPAAQVQQQGDEEHAIYDASNPTTQKLAKAFQEAIAHHLSLSPEQRAANSYRMAQRVGKWVGFTKKKGVPKDLLGKNVKLNKTSEGYEGFEPIKLPDGRGVETTGLALSPAFRMGKFNTCPNSASCAKECLGKTSGNYFALGGGRNLDEFKGPRLNSLNKTIAFLSDPHAFAVKLYDEITQAKELAAAQNSHLGIRPNVLSDIHPIVFKPLMDAHDDVTFYDYTKNKTKPVAPNHHLTYSSTGVSDDDVHNPNSNWSRMRKNLLEGENVAMSFTDPHHLPEWVHDEETGHKFKVIDGDDHDFRPFDMQPEGEHGVVIGLRNKSALRKKGGGKDAHVESSGFFVKYDPQYQMVPKGGNSKKMIYARTPSPGKNKKGHALPGEKIPTNRIVTIKPQVTQAAPLDNDGELA